MATRKLLIVDDEQDITDPLKDYLESYGFSVATALDGQSALEHLTKHTVDLVMTDVKMPNIDGYELIANMAKNFPMIKIFILSGFAAIDDKEIKSIPGVVAFEYKPLPPKKILEVLEKFFPG